MLRDIRAGDMRLRRCANILPRNSHFLKCHNRLIELPRFARALHDEGIGIPFTCHTAANIVSNYKTSSYVRELDFAGVNNALQEAEQTHDLVTKYKTVRFHMPISRLRSASLTFNSIVVPPNRDS